MWEEYNSTGRVQDTGGSRRRKDLFCFRGTPSSHSLSTAASRCILHANNSVRTIVHAAYNVHQRRRSNGFSLIQSDVSLILSVHRLQRLYPFGHYIESHIHIADSHWIWKKNACYLNTQRDSSYAKLPVRPCSSILFLCSSMFFVSRNWRCLLMSTVTLPIHYFSTASRP